MFQYTTRQASLPHGTLSCIHLHSLYPKRLLHAFQLHSNCPLPHDCPTMRVMWGESTTWYALECFGRVQEYYTSGFLSLQAAIDAYVLDISSGLETSLHTGAGNISLPGSRGSFQQQSYWTQWGAVFPTAEYIHNEFYDGVSLCSFCGSASQSKSAKTRGGRCPTFTCLSYCWKVLPCDLEVYWGHHRHLLQVGPMLGLLMSLSLVYPLSMLVSPFH